MMRGISGSEGQTVPPGKITNRLFSSNFNYDNWRWEAGFLQASNGLNHCGGGTMPSTSRDYVARAKANLFGNDLFVFK